MHDANCNTKNVRKVLMKHFDSNHVIILSCKDKLIVKIKALGFPLASCAKIKTGWKAETIEVIATDHDTAIKSNLVHTVTFDIDIPRTANLGIFYNRDAHAGVKDSAILPTSAVMQVMEIGWVMMNKLNKSVFLFIKPDGRGDRNNRFDRAQALHLFLAQKHNLQKIICAKVSILPKFMMPNVTS